MIVGIDPGTTIGIAVLSIDGQLLELSSYRNKPMGEVVSILANYSPAVIATDVKPVPKTVRKLSVAFNATLFFPTKLFSVNEKNLLTKAYKTENDHERDALAAALKAYQHFSPKIRKAKRIAKEKQEEIVRASLEKVRIADVVKSATSIEKKREQEEVSKLRKELGAEKKKTLELKRQLMESRKKISKARKRMVQLESKLGRFERAREQTESEKRKIREEKERDRALSVAEVEELFKEYKKLES